MRGVEKLKDLVGPENFSDDPETLEAYSSDLSFLPPRKPLCVVRPGSTEEVREIVRWANETRIPLIPVSSGPPRLRGDTVPVLGGVVVDLSRMNRTRMVDRVDRVAMVEPGVRWGELQEAVRKEGMRVPMPLSPRANKSVVGSCLEREPHILPKYHLDHSEPLLCTEVVWGTGDLYRTGEAAGPGTIEEQWKVGRRQKQPLGVQVDEVRLLQGAQGTLGIVTWITVRCEVLPRLQKPFLVGSGRLEPLLELERWMVRMRIPDELFLLNGLNLACLVGKNQGEIQDLRDSLPPWILFYSLSGHEYFPEERVGYLEEEVRGLAERVGVNPAEALSGLRAREVLEAATSTSDPYWKLRYRGNCQELFFISSFSQLPRLVEVMRRVAGEEGIPLEEVGVYLQPVCQGHGHHCEFDLFYSPQDPGKRERVRKVYLRAARELMREGAFFSRPYDLLAEEVLNRDAVTREALRKIKDIFDPCHVLNPGRLCF